LGQPPAFKGAGDVETGRISALAYDSRNQPHINYLDSRRGDLMVTHFWSGGFRFREVLRRFYTKIRIEDNNTRLIG
jgi:hypothetical protein